MRNQRALKTLIGVAVVLILAALLPTRSDTTWVDPVTGSVKRQRSWQICWQAPVIEPSALERWIIRREGSHTRAWRFVSRTKRTIFGQPLSIASSEAPMFLLRAGDRNDRFVHASTDDQIAGFVRIMRTGSEPERREAVRTASQSISRDD